VVFVWSKQVAKYHWRNIHLFFLIVFYKRKASSIIEDLDDISFPVRSRKQYLENIITLH
jgi:hypothetical protein